MSLQNLRPSSRAFSTLLLAPLLAGLLVAGPPGELGAQAAGQDELPPGLHLGLGLVFAQPTGEFRDYVDFGGGIRGFVRFDFEETGRLGLRIEFAAMTYGRETKQVCLSETVGCRITVDLTTSNNIFVGGLGPELVVPVGFLELHGAVTGGFSYFSTTSSVQGTRDQEPFASSENYGDGGWGWNWGGGFRIPIARGRIPVRLEAGLARQRNGRREYLTRGDIQELPGGEIQLNPRRSDADFLMWTIGLTFGATRTERGS